MTSKLIRNLFQMFYICGLQIKVKAIAEVSMDHVYGCKNVPVGQISDEVHHSR